MKSLSKNKGTLGILTVFVLVIYVYNMFGTSIFPDTTTNENIGSDLVELYASLQNVTLDQNLISSPLYRSLTDYSVELTPEPSGRPNPFNTLGRD